MYLKRSITIFSFLLIFTSYFEKVNSIEPDVFVQSTVNRAAKTLSGNLSKKERIEIEMERMRRG